MNDEIKNEFLLEYIATMPEISGWHLRRIDRNEFWPEWRTFTLQLCHTSFANESLPVASLDNGNEDRLAEYLKNQINAEKDQPHHEDEALTLYGVEL